MPAAHPDLSVTTDEAPHVVVVEIVRPPHNYFDQALLAGLGDLWEELDADPACRAVVLCSQGKNFCAGRDFRSPRAQGDSTEALYEQAARLVACRTPWVAAVQGAAIGGGLGLAMAADFRVVADNASFSANFAQLGFHHGFGLTVTLPLAVGHQRATSLLYTGERIHAASAVAAGLVDVVVDEAGLRQEAVGLAARIASAAPLAVQAIRATMRDGLEERFRAACAREAAEQGRLRDTGDFEEGLTAAKERRAPQFRGH